MDVKMYGVAREAGKEDLAGACAVVIDVLRMTSTAVAALANGARGIRLIGDEQAARRAAEAEGALLGGERKGLRLSGFAFGNSPLEYTPEKVKERSIVMTTSNGARAFEAAAGAEEICLCAFTNVSAVARAVRKFEKVVILCAGTKDQFSLDDALCAGALASRLQPEAENDMCAAARLLYGANRRDIASCLSNAYHYRYLASIGFQEDLRYCLREDLLDCVPFADADGWLRA